MHHDCLQPGRQLLSSFSVRHPSQLCLILRVLHLLWELRMHVCISLSFDQPACTYKHGMVLQKTYGQLLTCHGRNCRASNDFEHGPPSEVDGLSWWARNAIHVCSMLDCYTIPASCFKLAAVNKSDYCFKDCPVTNVTRTACTAPRL